MGTTEKLMKASEIFPAISIRSSSVSSARKYFKKLDERKFIGMSLAIGLVAGLCGLIIGIIIGGAMQGVAGFLLAFALIFTVIANIPAMELRSIEKRAEQELPFLLIELSMLLELGLSFDNAIQIVSERKGVMNVELMNSVTEMKHGATTQKALTDLAVKFKSTRIKRAITQLISVYEVGSGSQNIRIIAEDLFNIQQNTFRQESTKSSIYGLIFITVSAIVPTFFIIMSLSDLFLNETTANPNLGKDIAFWLLVIVPVIGLFASWMVKNNLSGYIIEKRKKDISNYYLFGAGVILVIASIMATGVAVILVAVILIIAVAIVFYKQHQEDKKVENIEANLPDALMALSSLPAGARAERIFETMKPYGELGNEFSTALKQIKSNVKAEDAINRLSERNNSYLLDQMCTALTSAIRSGKIDRLDAIAEHITKMFEVKRERESLLSIQKYTIFLGAIVVPVVIRFSFNLTESFRGMTERAIDFGVIENIIPAYLVMYAMVSAYYLASIEEKKSRKIINFILIVILSNLVFYLARP